MRTYLLVLRALRVTYPDASDQLRQYAAMARVSCYLPAHNAVRLPVERLLSPETWRKAGAL